MVTKVKSGRMAKGGADLAREAARLLARLEKGGAAPVAADAATIDLLRARDLVRTDASGHLVINEQGRAFLRRIRALRRRQKAMAAGAFENAAIRNPFRDQHLSIREQKGQPGEREAVSVQSGGTKKQSFWVNDKESPLAWLRRRRAGNGRLLLTGEQAEAGERLRVDFELAGLSPKVTSSWDGMPVSGGRSAYRDLEPSEVQAMARRRVHRALDVLGPGLADVAVHICCLLEGLEQTERRMGWPARSGKVVLGLALDRLAHHYGTKI